MSSCHSVIWWRMPVCDHVILSLCVIWWRMLLYDHLILSLCVIWWRMIFCDHVILSLCVIWWRMLLYDHVILSLCVIWWRMLLCDHVILSLCVIWWRMPLCDHVILSLCVIWWRMLLCDHVILSLCNWSTKIKSNVNRQLVLLSKSVRTDIGHVYLMFSNKWCWYGVNYWLNVRRDVEQHVYNVFIRSDHWHQNLTSWRWNHVNN